MKMCVDESCFDVKPRRLAAIARRKRKPSDLRYGLAIALSTLNPCRYLHEPKTRFPVGRLFPFPGRELNPLKAPGLSWRTEESWECPEIFLSRPLPSTLEYG